MSGRQDLAMAIRAAAWKVVSAQGASGVTVRAVAAEAGCSVGALYTHYRDKEMLLIALSLDSLTQLGREVAANVDPESGIAEAHRRTVAAFRTVYGHGRPSASLLPVLMGNSAIWENAVSRKVTGRLMAALGPVANACQRSGRSADAANADTLAIVSCAIGLVLLDSSGQLDRMQVASEEVAAHLSSLVSDAVAARTGHGFPPPAVVQT